MRNICAATSIALLALLFAGSLPNPTSGECTKHTCLNNGTCDKSFHGKGFKCICPQRGFSDYGPRCELVVRSYLTSMPKAYYPLYMMTKHSITPHPLSNDSVIISFDFNVLCWYSPCYFFVINGPDSRPLVTFEVHQTPSVHAIYIWSPAHQNHTDRARSIAFTGTEISQQSWRENWQSLYFHLWKNNESVLTIHAQLCSLNMISCMDTTVTHQYGGDLQSTFKKSVVSIGRMAGCIRYPRINGVLMDLGNVIGFVGKDGAVARTYPFCYFSQFSCMRIVFNEDLLENYCGMDSVCDPMLNSADPFGVSDRCTCRCVSAKRRLRETIADNDKCAKGSVPENECTVDTPIMSTDSSNYDVKWTAQNDGPISVGLSFFSIEATVKTRQTNVPEMLSLNNGNESLPQIRISNGHLEVCIGASCYPFPKVSVADDEWHSLSVTIRLRELTAMLDMSTTVHLLTTAFKFPGAKVTLSIPNSCVRAVRLSNVYMPTGDADVTADNATAFIKVHMGSGVSAKTICTAKKDISACQCGAFEYCNVTSGSSICNCMTDFVRDKDGNCTLEKRIPTPSDAPQESAIVCKCGAYEYCDVTSGAPKCNCMTDFVRDKDGNCTLEKRIPTPSDAPQESAIACKCGAFEYCNVTSGSAMCNCMTDFVRDENGSCIHEVFFSLHNPFSNIAQKIRSGCIALFASFSLLLVSLNER